MRKMLSLVRRMKGVSSGWAGVFRLKQAVCCITARHTPTNAPAPTSTRRGPSSLLSGFSSGGEPDVFSP